MQQALEEWLLESRTIVLASHLAAFMQRVFATDIERGPPLRWDDHAMARLRARTA